MRVLLKTVLAQKLKPSIESKYGRSHLLSLSPCVYYSLSFLEYPIKMLRKYYQTNHY